MTTQEPHRDTETEIAHEPVRTAGVDVTLPLGEAPTFPRSCWWVAARSTDIGRELTPVRVAGLDLVLYRTNEGRVVVLDDACPHRWMPLSSGVLEGDTVRCGYHGVAFDSTGSCIEVPSQDRIPGRMCVRSRPVVERFKWVWVWTGLAESANPDDIPMIPGVGQTGWATIGGAMPLAANYLRGHENVLDLSHFEYLHPGTVGTDAWTKLNPTISVDDGGLTVTRDLPNAQAAPFTSAMGIEPDSLVDRQTVSLVPTPAVHIAETLVRSPAGEGAEFRQVIVHAFTPCDERTSLYFFLIARDWHVDDAELSQRLGAMTESVFAQDKVALEAIERVALRTEFPTTEISVRADQAGLQLRRFVRRLIDSDPCSR